MERIDHDYLSIQVIQIPSKSKTSFSIAVLHSKNIPSFPFRRCVYYSKCPTDKWQASVNSF